MKEPNEVIGIDPGFTNIGVVTLHPRSGDLKRHMLLDGTIHRSKSSVELGNSLRAFGIAREIFEEIAKEPGTKIVVVEGPSLFSGSRSFITAEKLARARQALYDLAGFYLEDFIYYEIAPTEAKKALTGNGKATKDMMGDMAERQYPTFPHWRKKDNTLADALGIALCGLNKYKVARLKGSADG